MPQQMQLLFPRSTPTRPTALPGARLKRQLPSPPIKRQNGIKSDCQRTPLKMVAARKSQVKRSPSPSQNQNPTQSKPRKSARMSVSQGLRPMGRRCHGLLPRKIVKRSKSQMMRPERQHVAKRMGRTRQWRESEPPSCAILSLDIDVSLALAQSYQTLELQPTRRLSHSQNFNSLDTSVSGKPALPIVLSYCLSLQHPSPSDSNSDFQLSTPHKPSGQPTPTWAKEAAGYTASSPALETEEADLGEGRGDTSGEVDFRPGKMLVPISQSVPDLFLGQ